MFKKIGNLVHRLFSTFLSAMAWVVLGLAVVGGLAATGTFLADVFGWFVGILSWIVGVFIPGTGWWLPYLLIVIGFFCVLCDIARDGIPERLAVYIPMIWPSLFLAVPEDAKLREKITGWIDSLNAWLDGNIGPWVGGDTNQEALMTVVAVCCLGASIFFMERYASTLGGKGKGAAAPATAPATGGRPPVAARRAR